MSAITDKHKAFARAVVALAREHQMDNLLFKFRLNFDARHLSEDWANDEVTATWHSGRHGDTNNIGLECRAATGISETAPVNQPTGTGRKA